MSTDPPPPDRPTERLQPTAPPPAPRPPIHAERVVTPAADPGVVLLRLEDAIGSLRTGLMIVGVIAVAALGVAIYSLLQDDDAGGSPSGAASDARVSRLDDRIDRISRQVQSLRSAGGTSSDGVEERVAALEKTVQTLADRPSTDPQQAIDELSERIDGVAQDVEALERQAQTTP